MSGGRKSSRHVGLKRKDARGEHVRDKCVIVAGLKGTGERRDLTQKRLPVVIEMSRGGGAAQTTSSFHPETNGGSQLG